MTFTAHVPTREDKKESLNKLEKVVLRVSPDQIDNDEVPAELVACIGKCLRLEITPSVILKVLEPLLQAEDAESIPF
ncbi:MAG: hypothetical protein HY507_01105 [Candidatus Zambryskibacteria bacterium]|nr:hypothetical protein [Candidatus Zambryskibacteria bacterium]